MEKDSSKEKKCRQKWLHLNGLDVFVSPDKAYSKHLRHFSVRREPLGRRALTLPQSVLFSFRGSARTEEPTLGVFSEFQH